MIQSPHFNNAIALATQLNYIFTRSFDLKTPFRYDDVLPGEHYGLINFRYLRQGAYQAHNAVEQRPLIMDALIVIGCKDMYEASQMELAWLINADHVSNAIKTLDEFDGAVLLHDLQITGDITAVPRQSVKPLEDSEDPHPKVKNGRNGRPIHPWIVDISWEMQGMLNIPKGYDGQHIQYQEIDIQATTYINPIPR
jgi:hypothetical protein